MSHSVVVVVIRDAANADEAGDKLEELLDPFNENKDVPHVEEVAEEEVERAVAFYTEHPEHLVDADEPAESIGELTEDIKNDPLEYGRWKARCVGAFCGNGASSGSYNGIDQTFSYESTYNPKSRWDWYALGGRWRGFFELRLNKTTSVLPSPFSPVSSGERKDEAGAQLAPFDGTQDAVVGQHGVFGDAEGENFTGRADLARKSDIDFAAMRSQAQLEAELGYDKFEEATAGIEPADRWIDMFKAELAAHDVDPEVVSNHAASAALDEDGRKRFEQARDAARAKRQEHPWIKALAGAGLNSWFEEERDLWCVDDGGRAEYVRRAGAAAAVPFAVLMDGEWHERGSMGWWGMVSNEEDADVWRDRVAKLYDDLPDDVFLAAVDVHI